MDKFAPEPDVHHKNSLQVSQSVCALIESLIGGRFWSLMQLICIWWDLSAAIYLLSLLHGLLVDKVHVDEKRIKDAASDEEIASASDEKRIKDEARNDELELASASESPARADSKLPQEH